MIFTEKNNLEQEDIIVLVSPWKAPRFLYYLIKKVIPSRYGYIHYSYAKELLNSDPESTKRNFLQFIEKITRDMNELVLTKPRNFFLYGQSLGGLFCMIVADKVAVKKAMIVASGANLAESIWYGNSTRELRQDMEKNGMSLMELKSCWQEISPDSYFKDKGRRAKFYIIISTNDKTIPTDNGRKLIEIIKKQCAEFKITETFLPHMPTCVKESLFTGNFYKCFIENKEGLEMNIT